MIQQAYHRARPNQRFTKVVKIENVKREPARANGHRRQRARPEEAVGCRRQSLGLLDGTGRGLSGNPPSALLGAQDRQRAECASGDVAAQGQAGLASDLGRRYTRGCASCV